MISIIEACEKAQSIFNNRRSEKIAEIKDAGDKWILSAHYARTNYCGSIIFIAKKDGSISPFDVTDEENLKLIRQSKAVKIPKEFA